VLEQSEANDEENFEGQKKKVVAEKQKIAKVNSSYKPLLILGNN